MRDRIWDNLQQRVGSEIFVVVDIGLDANALNTLNCLFILFVKSELNIGFAELRLLPASCGSGVEEARTRFGSEAFGEGNGVRSLAEMRERISKYRRVPIGLTENPNIGCILLAEPFFFSEADWIPVPSDFSKNIVQGKGYDSEDGASGAVLWKSVVERLSADVSAVLNAGPATVAAVQSARYGEPTLVRPRLGQGAFRVIVTDAYDRRCAITGERTLPVLEAAHIKPYNIGGPHDPENGLLLRSDLHTLFDQGYVTVDADDLKVLVSRRIREEFENGRDYYALHGRAIRLPHDTSSLPSREYLKFHNDLFL